MRELPKVARERLAATPVSTPHLDSNLIAAFVEHALPPGERQGVIAHMAVCAQCRNEVQLVIGANRPDVQAAEAVRGLSAEAGSRSGGFSWQRLLRWQPISAAAGLLAISFAFWVATRRPTSHAVPPANAPLTTMAGKTAPAPPATGIREAARVPAPSPAPPARARQMLARALPSAQSAATARSHVLKGDQRKAPTEVLTLASGNTGPTVLETGAKQPESIVVAAAPPPPAPAAPVPQSGGVGGVPGTAAGPAGTVAAGQAAPKPVSPEIVSAELGTETAPAHGVERAPTVLSLHKSLAAESPKASRRLVRLMESEVRWAVAADATSAQSNPGTVEKSLDGGRTWQPVPVAPGVTFRVVFALGRDVWAGGLRGAFYHSSDGGEHWSAVPLAAASGAVTGDIVSIQFADASHGVARASSGQTWTTSDSGRTWQVQ